MKHVVFLKGGSAKKGGLEKYTRELILGFLKRDCKVTLLTSGPVDREPNFETIPLCNKSKFSFLHLKRFDQACNRWIKTHRPTLVFGLDRNSIQTHYRAGNGVHAAYLQRRKHENGFLKNLTFELNPLHRTILSLEKKTYEGPATRRIFTNSDMVKQEILTHYAADAAKISVIHNGVDLRAYQPRLATGSPIHQFLFIGHGWHRKGLAYLLQALSLMKNEPFHLKVIGRDSKASFFQKLTKTLGLQNKVAFLGSQNSVIPDLETSDTLVVPSTYDPFANVTLEALAMGLFVVTSKYNGGHEVINEENGCVIENLYDPFSFVEGLKKALATPKTTESIKKIRATIQNLSLEHQIEKMVDQSLIDAS